MGKVDVLRGGSGKWIAFKIERGIRSGGQFAIPLASGMVRGDHNWIERFRQAIQREALNFSGVNRNYLRGGQLLSGVEIPDDAYTRLLAERASNVDALTDRELVELFEQAEHENYMLE